MQPTTPKNFLHRDAKGDLLGLNLSQAWCFGPAKSPWLAGIGNGSAHLVRMLRALSGVTQQAREEADLDPEAPT